MNHQTKIQTKYLEENDACYNSSYRHIFSLYADGFKHKLATTQTWRDIDLEKLMKLHSDYINEPLDSHGTNRHSMWLQLNNIGFRKNINSTEDLLGSQYVLQLIWCIYKR